MQIGTLINDSRGYLGAFMGFALRSDRALTLPVAAAIEPTSRCNLRCPLCAAGAGTLDRPAGAMTVGAFARLVENLPATVSTLYLWGQGEPFLAPRFLNMVALAAKTGRRTIVSTNGHYLDDVAGIVQSGMSTLIVSLDGIDAETYRAYRVGGDFARVTGGIRSVAEEKRRAGRGPEIVVQFLVTSKNASSLGDVRAFAAGLGADRTVFKTLQAAWMEGGEALVPDNPALSRYRRAPDGSLVPDRRWFIGNRCLRLYYSFQIDWQGNVVPCCFDKNSGHILGNVFETGIAAIWNGPAYRAFRRVMNRSGRILPMCTDCSEGVKRMEFNG